MKRYKKELDGFLEVGQVLYTKHFALSLDRSLCKGCELCRLACPRHAVKLVPSESKDGKAVAHTVDIDENKCDFHGICAVVCPFNAIKLTMNGREEIPAVSKGVFPVLTRDIKADRAQCEPGCKKCEEVCPLGIVSVKDDGIDIQKELCAGCQICWMECPSDAIEVTKFIEGSIQITPELCPEDCRNCLDVCPVNALDMGVDGKVFARDINCVYCGACRQVCPNREALKIERTALRHSPVDSGAWNRGLERLTSTAGLMRELAAERAIKARSAIHNLQNEVNK